MTEMTEEMDTALNKGERLRLTVGDGSKKHVRIKSWVDNTCVCVSYSNDPAFEPGAVLAMEGLAEAPKRIYYMQYYGRPLRDGNSLLLRRNPAATFNHRRNNWRVPYTGATAIRQKGARHFLSAQFTDLSMDAARLLSEVRLLPGIDVDIRLELPEFPEHIVTGITVRASDAPLRTDVYGKQMYGLVVRFESLSDLALRHLTFFMWQRVRKTYAREMRLIFDSTHRHKMIGAPPPPEPATVSK